MTMVVSKNIHDHVFSFYFWSHYSLLSLYVDCARHGKLLLMWRKMFFSEVLCKILMGMSVCILLKEIVTTCLMLKLISEQFSSTF